jgi:hypothetical protein
MEESKGMLSVASVESVYGRNVTVKVKMKVMMGDDLVFKVPVFVGDASDFDEILAKARQQLKEYFMACCEELGKDGLRFS